MRSSAFECVRVGLPQRTSADVAADRVDEDVEAAAFLNEFGDQPLGGCEVGHVGLRTGESWRARRALQRVEFLGAPICDGYLRALGEQCLRHGAAERAAPAGHQRDLTVESIAHERSPC